MPSRLSIKESWNTNTGSSSTSTDNTSTSFSDKQSGLGGSSTSGTRSSSRTSSRSSRSSSSYPTPPTTPYTQDTTSTSFSDKQLGLGGKYTEPVQQQTTKTSSRSPADYILARTKRQPSPDAINVYNNPLIPKRVREGVGTITMQQGYEQLSNPEKIEYTKRYGRFGEEEKTWSEFKRDEPAAVLQIQPGGDVGVSLDTLGWWRTRKAQSDPSLHNIKMFSYGVTRAFDFDFWRSHFTGKGSQYAADFEYKMMQGFNLGKKNPDYLGAMVQLNLPTWENVVLPSVAGAGAGALFRGLGAASRIATGTTSRILSHAATKGPWIVGTAASGYVGYDIGKTFALEHKGELPAGSGLAKIGKYGTQLTAAVAGGSVISRWKPVIGVRQSGDVLQFQKHVTSFRGRPTLPYGKIVSLAETSSGIGKVVSPFVSRSGALEFQTLKNFRVNLGMSSTTPPRGTGIDLGYGSVGGKPSSIFEIKWPRSAQFTEYNKNWYFMDTGKGWQGSSGAHMPLRYPMVRYQPKSLIDYVYPMAPARYGIYYNMPYQSVLDMPMILESGSFTTTEGMVSLKKLGRIFDMKDLSKHGVIDTGKGSAGIQIGGGSRSGQQTVQIQETMQKQALDQVLHLEKISLRHPLYGQQALQQYLLRSSKVSMRSPMYQYKSITSSKKAFGMVPLSLVRSADRQEFKMASAVISLPLLGSLKVSGFDSLKASKYSMDADMSGVLSHSVKLPRFAIPHVPSYAPVFPSSVAPAWFGVSHKSSKSTVAPMSDFPRISLHGRGVYSNLDYLVKPRYLFRMFKLPKLSDVLKGFKI